MNVDVAKAGTFCFPFLSASLGRACVYVSHFSQQLFFYSFWIQHKVKELQDFSHLYTKACVSNFYLASKK